MEGFRNLPQHSDIRYFHANSPTASVGLDVWRKLPGATMVHIFCLGGGGGGGNGVVGANSTAAGGGGGGSGSQTVLEMPAVFLPDMLWVCVGFGGAANTAGIASSVLMFPKVLPNNTPDLSNIIAVGNGGGAGGNASGATAGSAGSAGAIPNAGTQLCFGTQFARYVAGQAGVAGNSTGVGTSNAMPTTGLLASGGCGGAGLGAAGAAGSAGGTYSSTGFFDVPPRGTGGSSATTPAGNGSNGYPPLPGLFFQWGGTGGGSSHGSATGAGLVGGLGGAGGYGSGGGGGGGALTGSTQGTGGKGGDGIVVIMQW
jgi:hypothetical protein